MLAKVRTRPVMHGVPPDQARWVSPFIQNLHADLLELQNTVNGSAFATSGIASISGTNSSATVTVVGMTTTGRVVVWLENSSAGPVIAWPTYGAGQFTINVPMAPEITPGDGRVFNIGWLKVRDSSADAGFTESGVATITGANTSVVVALPGMTTGGQVAVWLENSTGGPVIPWATYQANQFTVHVALAPEISGGDGLVFNIGWILIKKS